MRQFAVFDIDGTLIRWQLYHVVVDRLAKAGQLHSGAAEHLAEARMRWKRREHVDAFSQYEKTLIGIYEDALPTIDPEQFDTLVHGVIEEYKEQVYRYTRDLVRTLKKQNCVLLAISGSHHELVSEIAKFYEFDDWTGTQYERAGKRYSGKSFIASQHKERLLKDLIKKHRLTLTGSYAVGDSKSDAPMLEMVEHPIAFNPDAQLYSAAKEKKWNIVVERKNVIYQLQPNKEGTYELSSS